MKKQIQLERISRFPEFSFVPNKGILTPNELKRKPKCISMDEEWKQAINSRWYWATGFTGSILDFVSTNATKQQKKNHIKTR